MRIAIDTTTRIELVTASDIDTATRIEIVTARRIGIDMAPRIDTATRIEIVTATRIELVTARDIDTATRIYIGATNHVAIRRAMRAGHNPMEHAGVVANWLRQPQVLVSNIEIDPGVTHPHKHCNVWTAISVAKCA